ncbi:MAG TPA: PEGA domain-containing protein [Vicinamibacterales bacterium]
MSAVRQPRAVSVSTAGYEDGLGRRSVRFDREIGGMLECLQLRPELWAFQETLQRRAHAIASLEDERFVRVRAIERGPQGLTVVSELVPGGRLVDIIEARQNDDGACFGIDAALGFLLRVLPALSRLHSNSIAHGALAAGRIVVTPAAQLVLLDNIYGSALERLNLSRAALWSSLGVLSLPFAGASRFDRRSDVMQASLCAATLALGRTIDDVPTQASLSALVREVAELGQIRAGSRFSQGVLEFLTATLPVTGRAPDMATDAAVTFVERLAGLIGEDEAHAAFEAFAGYESQSTSELPPESEDDDFDAAGESLESEGAEAFSEHEDTAEEEASDDEDEEDDDDGLTVGADAEPAPVTAAPPPPIPAAPAAQVPEVPPPAAPAASAPPPIAPAPPVTPPPIAPAPAPTPSVAVPPVAPAASVSPIAPAPPVIPPPIAPAPAPTPSVAVPPAAAAPYVPPIAPAPPRIAPPIAAAPPVVVPRVTPPAIHAPDVAPPGPPPIAITVAPPAPVRVRTEPPAGFTPSPAPDAPPPVRALPFVDRVPVEEPRTFPWKIAAAAVILLAIAGFAAWSYLPGSSEVARTAQTEATEEAPPAAAATPTTGHLGTLSVESQPAGAKVLMDGKEVGITPLTLDALQPGRRTITVTNGNATIRRTVRIEAGRTVSVDVPIYPGWISVFSPIRLDIATAGKSIGSTETGKIMLPPGTHVLTLSNQEFGYTDTRRVEIHPGEERPLNIEPRATVNLNAHPWAEVFIDGKKAGDTPIANLPVLLGTRVFIFRHPQFGERRITQTITSAGAALSVDLTKN